MAKFTTVTELHTENNAAIISYFEEVCGIYGSAKRKTYQFLKHADKFEKAKFNTELQNRYAMTKRSANSVIYDSQGTLKALIKLKAYELERLTSKIEYFEAELLPGLEKKRDKYSESLRKCQMEELIVKQRNLRSKIVAKKNKLNKMKQQASNLKQQIANKDYCVCFGTKHLLQSDIKAFQSKRDSVLSFVGSKDETCCNQMFQLTYNPGNNQFDIKVRKDYLGYKDIKDGKYVYGKCYFSHYKKEIIHILTEKTSPLSYRIIRKNGRYYLYCTFEINNGNLLTHSEAGVIGIDFNKGFVAVSETNYYGHLTASKQFDYRFKMGDATTTDLEKIANTICTYALQTGKSVCIEDLDFKKAKSKREKKQGKKYNDMLHSLAYRKFTSIMQNVACRRKVELIKVNPAWTSWLGEQLFCYRMKLNIHTAASFIIARRGMGIKDKAV